MIVLGIESSTPVASVALVGEKGLRGEMSLNIGLTHSEQLLPLIDDLLSQTKTGLKEIQGIAVAGGPGSFTGLRIGMATAKGLAQGGDIPLVSVPTLQALAFSYAGSSFLIAPVLNAKRHEVYAGLYRFLCNRMEELLPARAIAPQEWAQTVSAFGNTVLFTGDGAELYGRIWEKELEDRALILPPVLTPARAASVAYLGRERLLAGSRDDLYALKPLYLRLAEVRIPRPTPCDAE